MQIQSWCVQTKKNRTIIPLQQNIGQLQLVNWNKTLDVYLFVVYLFPNIPYPGFKL